VTPPGRSSASRGRAAARGRLRTLLAGDLGIRLAIGLLAGLGIAGLLSGW
jgi:hypothetical protein